MIDDSHYDVRSNSGFNTYNVVATKFGWACSCPDYARHNAKCKLKLWLTEPQLVWQTAYDSNIFTNTL